MNGRRVGCVLAAGTEAMSCAAANGWAGGVFSAAGRPPRSPCTQSGFGFGRDRKADAE